MPVFDFEIHICPKCGSASVARKICNICGTSMVSTYLTVQNLVKDNIGNTKAVRNALDTLSIKYCDVAERRKCAGIKKTKERVFFSDTWKMLKQNVRICPKCGHITGASCFYMLDKCCICGTTYVDSKIGCRKYYNRGEESDAYMEKQQGRLRETLCLKSGLYDVAAWNRRLDIEKDRLPTRLESQLKDYSVLPDVGIIPALLNTPGSLRTGKEHVWGIFIAFQQHLAKYVFLLDNATEAEGVEYFAQLREFLSDAFNIIRLQYSAGQYEAIVMLSGYIADLCLQVSN